MKINAILTGPIVLALLVAPAFALACTCAPPPPPLDALADADAVFSGIVLNVVDRGDGFLVVTLATTASWKGVTTEQVVVITPDNGAACGYDFAVDVEYLVYAAGSPELMTHLCTRTVPLAWAAEDLAALGPPGVIGVEDPSWGALKSLYCR